MLYLKLFLLYSIIGFTFESNVYKISNSNNHSGILYGPYTIIYGFGGILSFYTNNKLDVITNPYLNLLICYILFTILCTITELIGGYLINKIFKIDKWNYTNHKYHFGKYICLDYALIWGILSLLFVKLSNNFFIKVSDLIPSYIAIITLIILIIDYIITIYTKTKIRN